MTEHDDELAALAAEAARIGVFRDASADLSAAIGHVRAVLSTGAMRSDPEYVAAAWAKLADARAAWKSAVLGQIDLDAARADVACPWLRNDRRARYRATLDRLEEIAG